MKDLSIEEFVRDRNEALMSVDETRIRAYYRKYGTDELPSDPLVFWGSVHKAITAIAGLPIEVRRASKAWLDQYGFSSYNDREL